MKRFIAIIVLLIIIVGICTFEEFFLHNFVKPFTTQANALSKQIEDNENITSNKEIITNYTALKNNWQKAKTTLCFFTNYEKIKSMDESFIKLESGIKNNDKDLANENISLICNYDKFLTYMMGFNINNLF